MRKYKNYTKAIEENLMIVDKGIDEEMARKLGVEARAQKEIPFKLNKAQRHFIKNASERNVILKARKMGFSSLVLAIGLIKFLYGKNERIVSMSFDQDAATMQLGRVKKFLQSYDHINGTQITKSLKTNRRNELALDSKDENGRPYTNTIRVGTANSSGFGRGDDITFLHLTEVSLASNIDTLLAGVGEAVIHNSMITLETTANGYNSFKTFWDECMAGERDYQPLFYDSAWEYDKKYVEQKRKNLGNKGPQEYPMTPEEAFITSGNVFFDTIALKSLKDRCIPPINKDPYFHEYRELQKGEFIIIACDTAWGGGDFCAAQFLSKDNVDVPMVYYKKTLASEMTPFIHHKAEEIFDRTGVQPVVCYERNNGGVAELDRLVGLNRNQKYLIYEQPTPQAQIKDGTPSKYGWDCVSPDTLVLKKDFTYIRADEVKDDDELLAFDEKPRPKGGQGRWGYNHRQFTVQNVTGTTKFKAEGYRVTLEDGRQITVSSNHPFLAWRSDCGEFWRKADELYEGIKLKALPLWRNLQTYDAGRLSGLLCADGYLNSSFNKETNRYTGLRMLVSQSQGELADEIDKLWKKCGFDVTSKNIRHVAPDRQHHKTMVYTGVNSLVDVLAALGKLQPKRLIRKFYDKNFLSAYTTRCVPRLRVTKIEKLGMVDVIGIETSGHTLIANGVLSHNTTSVTRPTMLSMLKEAIDGQFIRIYHDQTISDMFSFVEKQTNSGRWMAVAEHGAHDDNVMALAIAWQLYQTEEKPRQVSKSTITGEASSLWV